MSCLYFLKNFVVSIITFRYLYSLGFILCLVLGCFLISFSFSWLKESSRCPPEWLLPIYIPSISGGGFPCLHTLSSIYCLWSVWQWPFLPVWCDNSLYFRIAFLYCLAMLTSFHVIFFFNVWLKLTSWNWLLENTSLYFRIAFLYCLAMLTSFHVIFFNVWLKLTSWNNACLVLDSFSMTTLRTFLEGRCVLLTAPGP